MWDLASESVGDDTLGEEENAHVSVLSMHILLRGSLLYKRLPVSQYAGKC